MIPRRRTIHLEPPTILPDMLANSYGTGAPAPRATGCTWPRCTCDTADTGCPREDDHPEPPRPAA